MLQLTRGPRTPECTHSQGQVGTLPHGFAHMHSAPTTLLPVLMLWASDSLVRKEAPEVPTRSPTCISRVKGGFLVLQLRPASSTESPHCTQERALGITDLWSRRSLSNGHPQQ